MKLIIHFEELASRSAVLENIAPNKPVGRARPVGTVLHKNKTLKTEILCREFIKFLKK